MTLPSLDWISPADAFRAVSEFEGDKIFYYSSMPTSYSGRYSLLAWDVEDRLETDSWQELELFLNRHADDYAFGYIGYEMLHELEDLPRTTVSYLKTPTAQLRTFRHALRFDHQLRRIDNVGSIAAPSLDASVKPGITLAPFVRSLHSSMTRSEYMDNVRMTRDAIHDGALYQANLTRKWYGELEGSVDSAKWFLRLQETSPAPYAAYLRLDDLEILSSSPELFLQVNDDGRLRVRPIKGSKRRHALSDELEREALQASEKDRAENLMIVDLMRNDLSRVAAPSSVKADRLFDIDSFKTIHHLSSEVEAVMNQSCTPIDAVRACFPPGSMTGAPKVAAMRWIANMETMQRGIYSGALGWFKGAASESSVVIRTLLLQGNRFEFQTGGGIVADSDPLAEWQESLDKALGIAQLMGLTEADLA